MLKIKIKLTLTQMNILSSAIEMVLDDKHMFGPHMAPVIDYHLTRINNKIADRRENTRPGKKSPLTLDAADAGMLVQSFSRTEYNRSTQSAILRGIISEVDRYF